MTTQPRATARGPRDVDFDDISHELRTSLTVLRGWLTIAATEKHVELVEHQEMFAICLASIDRLQRAVERAELAMLEHARSLDAELTARCICRHSR